MSLEQKIEALTAAVEANTAALLGAGGSTTSAPAAADETKKGRGRPAGSKAKPKDDDDLGGGLDDDSLGGGLDDAPAFTYQDCRTAMIALRDIGGEKANSADAKKVMVKFSLTSFADLDGQDDKYNEVMAYIKQLAKAKKVDL